DVKWTLMSTGAATRIGFYMPQRLAFSAERPAELKQAPDSLTAPIFGKLTIGPKESPTSVLLVLDEPSSPEPRIPARLFVDANGNGNLKDDPEVEWKAKPYKGKDGTEFKQYSGAMTVQVRFDGETHPLRLLMYRFDKADPQRSALKNVL